MVLAPFDSFFAWIGEIVSHFNGFPNQVRAHPSFAPTCQQPENALNSFSTEH
jgi:hypothetical protein